MTEVVDDRRKDGGVAKWIAPVGTALVGFGTGVGVSNTDAALEVLTRGGPAVIGAALGIGAALVIVKQQSAAFQTAFRSQSESRERSEKAQIDSRDRSEKALASAIDKLRDSNAAEMRPVAESLSGVREALSPLVAMVGLWVTERKD